MELELNDLEKYEIDDTLVGLVSNSFKWYCKDKKINPTIQNFVRYMLYYYDSFRDDAIEEYKDEILEDYRSSNSFCDSLEEIEDEEWKRDRL